MCPLRVLVELPPVVPLLLLLLLLVQSSV